MGCVFIFWKNVAMSVFVERTKSLFAAKKGAVKKLLASILTCLLFNMMVDVLKIRNNLTICLALGWNAYCLALFGLMCREYFMMC